MGTLGNPMGTLTLDLPLPLILGPKILKHVWRVDSDRARSISPLRVQYDGVRVISLH